MLQLYFLGSNVSENQNIQCIFHKQANMPWAGPETFKTSELVSGPAVDIAQIYQI